MKNADIEAKILHHLNFNASQGRTFEHLMKVVGFTAGQLVGDRPAFRILEAALQRLRKRGEIRFDKTLREWVIS